MPDLAVVCWLWNDQGRNYQPQHVNVLASMLKRHLRVPHRLVCITDLPGKFSADVDVLPIPKAAQGFAKIRTPEGARFPSCYRRLWLFSDEAKAIAGCVLLVDIDLVLTGDITHLVQRPEPFVGWRPRAEWGTNDRIGGGLYLMTTGSHPEVFDDFKGAASIRDARKAGYRGSDQAWISYKLARHVPTFDNDSGIYSVRDIKRYGFTLPEDARLVQFNGTNKPWTSVLPWVKDHWN